MAGKVEIKWEAPPPKRNETWGITKELIEALELLKAKPNTWARLATWEGESGAANARARLRKREFEQWQNGARFQFEVRRLEPGSALYAKYEVKRDGS